MAVNKVIYGGNTVIDLTGDTVTSDSLVEGATAHDKSGASITGTNPYEKTATDTEVTSQADLIAQIQTALEGKAAGGGGGASVTIGDFNYTTEMISPVGYDYTLSSPDLALSTRKVVLIFVNETTPSVISDYKNTNTFYVVMFRQNVEDGFEFGNPVKTATMSAPYGFTIDNESIILCEVEQYVDDEKVFNGFNYFAI